MQMQNRGTLFGGGIVMVVLGIIFLAFPGFTMSFFTVLAGIGFLAGGIAQIASLIAMGDFPMRAAAIASTAIMALFGLFALIWPPMVVQFVGISLIIEGVTAFVLGLTSKQSF